MHAGGGSLGAAAQAVQARLRVVIGVAGALQTGCRALHHHALRFDLFFEVFYLLRPRQHACLLAVLRIKMQAVRGHAMALRGVNHFTRRQLLALRQCAAQIRRGIAARQPMAEQGGQAGIVQAQIVSQGFEAVRGCRQGCGRSRRGIEHQFGAGRVSRKGR